MRWTHAPLLPSENKRHKGKLAKCSRKAECANSRYTEQEETETQAFEAGGLRRPTERGIWKDSEDLIATPSG